MNIEPNKYDKALSSFVSNDKLRPKMNKPFERGQFVYATDAHALIRVQKEYPALDYKQDHDFYDVERFFAEEPNCLSIVNQTVIDYWFTTVPLLSKYAPCEECDGEGDIHCGYCNHSHTCGECNGSGKGKKTGEEPDGNAKYLTAGTAFSYKNLKRLLLVAEQEGEQIQWVFNSKRSANIFKVGVFDIAIMPMNID